MFNDHVSRLTDYLSICQALIAHLTQKIIKSFKTECLEDRKFTISLKSIQKRLIDHETHKIAVRKTSEIIEDLVNICNNSYYSRSNSNNHSSPKRSVNSFATSKTPNYNKLDRVIEESPQLYKKKFGSKNIFKREPTHAYYQNMIGKYLKFSLKSPEKKSEINHSDSKLRVNQVLMKDGMFFRLY